MDISFFFLLLAFVIGAVFGSFITMLSYRLPKGENITSQRSACTSCKHPLGLLDLIPLLSWAFTRGRCRHCQENVHWRYPLIELSTALIATLLVFLVGVQPILWPLAILALCLITMTVIDFEYRIIPDSLQLIMVFAGLLWHYLQGNSIIQACIIGFLVMCFSLILRYLVSQWKKQEAMGLGDVKFFAVAGLWLPFESLPIFLFIAGFSGIILGLLWRFAGKGAAFPFGPALAAALFVSVLRLA